jgi:hypothetical protein
MNRTIEKNKEWTIHRWSANLPLIRETSYGIVDRREPAEVNFELGFHANGAQGYFELDGGDDDWYAEGSIQFDGKLVIGYDGCFELSREIMYELENLGYDLSEL